MTAVITAVNKLTAFQLPEANRLTDDLDLKGATEVANISDVPLFHGNNVFKMGRTTDLTSGIIHPVSIHVRALELPSNSKHKRPVRPTLEQQVILAPFPHLFNERGDSGSWILDKNGNLVGMVWGACVRSRCCYFTHIQDIIGDIERVTKRTVELYFRK